MRGRIVWACWLSGTLAATVFIALRLQSTDRAVFLPGETTAGHHQIELSCESCHTPFGGVEQQACLKCHEEELSVAEDSHPRGKFTDPRNAERVARLDARLCITCHVEHRPEMTLAMAVTLPADYCFLCHSDIADERASHTGMPFNTCASSGCHRFHDNRALYEDFLTKHGAGPETLPVRVVKERLRTAPVHGGIGCPDCHNVASDSGAKSWTDFPGYQVCQSCHAPEATGFLSGKHGIRLATGLSPMTPAAARLPMRPEAANRQLGCASCHPAHDFDTRRAAVDGCLGCHADNHSLAYKSSSHFRLWTADTEGSAPTGSGVSCATCHLPREVHRDGDQTVVRVQHNQNSNLRPNEKMIRDVCMSCHGLSFSIDALADRELIDANFSGRPSRHIESIDMAIRKAGNQ